MNLSDLVHRPTNEGHDHRMEPYLGPFFPTSPSSSSIITTTMTNTTAAAAATMQTLPVHTTNLNTSITSPSFIHRPERPYFFGGPLETSTHVGDEVWATALPHRGVKRPSHPSTNPSPNIASYAQGTSSSSNGSSDYMPISDHSSSSSSSLDQFYLSKTFFQPIPLAPASSPPHPPPQPQPFSHKQALLSQPHPYSQPQPQPSTSSASASSSPSFKSLSSSSQEKVVLSTSSSSSSPSSTALPAKKKVMVPLSDEELLRQRKKLRIQPLTITGDNVTAENIEDGYIQFILHHDPESIGDGIDSLMYARRKFSSVPRTGDLSYTTWDIFVLVNKLHNREIKNWSQLVGQLGLSDMLGRPQFAQRVKRWMHKYKIDYFFDYLMGTPFNFHSVDEKYSGCLLMGNYQKRKEGNDTDDTLQSSSTQHHQQQGSTQRQLRRRKQRQSTVHEPLHDQDRPILLAGSRKRMRGDTKSNILIIGKQQHQRRQEDEDEELEDEEEEEEEDGDGDSEMDLERGEDNRQTSDMEEDLLNDTDNHDDNNDDDNDNDIADENEEEGEDEKEEKRNSSQAVRTIEKQELEDDEEDELASTSSASGSPMMSNLSFSLSQPPSPSQRTQKDNEDEGENDTIAEEEDEDIQHSSFTHTSPSSSSPLQTTGTMATTTTVMTAETDTAAGPLHYSHDGSSLTRPISSPIAFHSSTSVSRSPSPSVSSSPASPSSPSPASPMSSSSSSTTSHSPSVVSAIQFPSLDAANTHPVTSPSSPLSCRSLPPHHLRSPSLCTSCDQLAATVVDLKQQLTRLTRQMDTLTSTWKPAMEKRCTQLEDQVATLTEEKKKWTAWRKKVIHDLLEEPYST